MATKNLRILALSAVVVIAATGCSSSGDSVGGHSDNVLYGGPTPVKAGSADITTKGLKYRLESVSAVPPSDLYQPSAANVTYKATISITNTTKAPVVFDDDVPISMTYGADRYDAEENPGYGDTNQAGADSTTRSKYPNQIAPGSTVMIWDGFDVPIAKKSPLTVTVQIATDPRNTPPVIFVNAVAQVR
jgi:hypothetical protein